MIRHLTPSDYKSMPWANGKGTTVEMLRVEAAGSLQWRLSRASVVEAGDFSLFPGIKRNLTVISGPGFVLRGAGFELLASPLHPVAFAGDVAMRAEQVTAPSDDFNVMTARDLPVPEVTVVRGAAEFSAGATLAVFALEPTEAAGRALAKYDLLLTTGAAKVSGSAIVVRLFSQEFGR